MIHARVPANAKPEDEPVTPSCTVTYDLTDPDTRHVLTQALEDYAARARDMASRDVGNEFFARWADIADRLRAKAEEAR